MGWGWTTCAFLALTAWTGTARAEGNASWAGFYSLKAENGIASNIPVPRSSGVCLEEILEAQDRYNIPDNILLAIGIQEAGRRVNGKLTIWPWTANARGKGVFFDNKEALEDWVRQTQSAGTQSVDVGCMQVNQKWHARHFASLEEATDPKANVDYAARFLLSLYGESRDWWQAAGRYHSSTEAYKSIYLDKLVQNQKLANGDISNFTKPGLRRSAAPTQGTKNPWYSPAISWTADMTGAHTDGVHRVLSIYSTSPLQALLPNYVEAN